MFILAPLVAEYLLGNIAIDALSPLLALAPLYGGGALLIREVARRTGRGWPAMVLLGLAYGLGEEGLVTQSLFNPDYAGVDLLGVTFIPALGIGVWWTLFVLTLHTVWSTSAPIAIVESFAPDRATSPWLGRIGLAIAAALLLLGAILSFFFTYQQSRFLATMPQLTVTIILIVALVVVAFIMPRSPRLPRATPAPLPWLVALASLTLTSLFMLATLFVDQFGGWLVVAIYVVLGVVAVCLILRWSRQTGWGQHHILALAGGALLTYAWHAFPQPPVLGSAGQVDLMGNAIFALGAVLLIVAAFRVGSRESRVGSQA